MSSIIPPTLLGNVRRVMRLKHYSLHTEPSAVLEDSETKIEAF
ncbi:hypothetical protein [Methylomonas sp. MgM2]